VLKGAGRELKFGRHLTDEQIRFTIAVLLDAARSIAAQGGHGIDSRGAAGG
jgi:hypothetical protein